MYILPTLTYLEVGGPAGASEIICFEQFNYEPIPFAWPPPPTRTGVPAPQPHFLEYRRGLR